MAHWGKPFKRGKSYFIYYYSGDYSQWKWLYRLPKPKWGSFQKSQTMKSVFKAFEPSRMR